MEPKTLENAGPGAHPPPVLPTALPMHQLRSDKGIPGDSDAGGEEHGRGGTKLFLKEVLVKQKAETSQGVGCNLSPKRKRKCEMVSACAPKETF